MRVLLSGVITMAVLTGCGGSEAQAGCQGLPTAKQSTPFLVLFGHAPNLTKRFVCAHFGAPASIKSAAGGREVWRYGNAGATITFRGDRALQVGTGRTRIGG